MFSLDEYFFKEQILPRLIIGGVMTICGFIAWFLFARWFFEPTPLEEWQQKAESLTVLASDSDITAAIAGEPRCYLIKNYMFDKGTTVSDTAFNLLVGDYLLIDIHRQVFMITRQSGGSKTERWDDSPCHSIVGGFVFNDGTAIQNADSLKFEFSSQKYWQNLKPECIDHNKIGHVQQDMYYYPDMTVNLDSIGNIISELPERFEESVDRTLEQFGKRTKTYDSRFTLSYMKIGDSATFVARLGGGKAEFCSLGGSNYMLVGCDNVSDVASGDISFSIGVKIAWWVFLGLMVLVVIIAPKILGVND